MSVGDVVGVVLALPLAWVVFKYTRKNRTHALSLALLPLLLAGRDCQSDCDKAKAAQAQLCTAGNLTSEECQAATALVVKICGAEPTPRPTLPPTPEPTPTPSPTPPQMQGPTCVSIGAACNCIDFPPPGNPTCVVCDPSAPGGVRSIGVVPVCPPTPGPTPTPTPGPTPVPTPRPTPTPPPGQCKFPQGVEDQLVEVPNPKTLASRVDRVISEHTGCAINSDCVLGQSDPQFYYSAMIGWLRADGLCAGQHNDGHTDELSVALTCQAGVVWENYHSVNYGDPRKVSWSGGGARSGWTAPVSCNGGPAPSPSPTPPATSCPPLTDLKMSTHSNNPGSMIVDVTPRGPDCPRCASIHKSCDKGVCPLGPEGPNPEDNAERIACEKSYGPYTFWLGGSKCGVDGVPCFFPDPEGNPLSVKVLQSGWVTVETPGGQTNGIDVVVP